MSRRKKSGFEDLFELTAMVPWWVGVVLALVSYFVMHQVATMTNVYPTNGKGVGHFVGKQMFITFAFYLQYILPVILLAGSAASAIKRQKRGDLHARIADAGTRESLEAMSWREFEQLVGEYFRRKGFSVAETGGRGADGGVDLVVSRGADRYLVQCKQWKARRVGVESVRELYGVMAAQGAAGGYVVTSGVFTDEAKRFAEGREIEIIGGDELVEIIGAQSASGKTTVAPHPNPLPARGARESSTGVTTSAPEAPSCPQCGSSMVLRTARKGANAGSSFWGCPQFPKCRGTRPA